MSVAGTMCHSCCKGTHLLNCVSHSGFVPESSFLGGTGDCCVAQVCTLHNDLSHRSKYHTCTSHTPALGHPYGHPREKLGPTKENSSSVNHK